jgi:hypothetical protein
MWVKLTYPMTSSSIIFHPKEEPLNVGIKLKSGDYKIEVSAKGNQPKKQPSEIG